MTGTSSSRYFPVSTREWENSICGFNKNTLKLIPVASDSATKLIKSYLSLINLKIDKKLRTKRLPNKLKRFSSNKIFIGNNEFKHTNDKVIINIYLFNRQKQNYFIKLKNNYEDWKNYNIIPFKKLFTIKQKIKKINKIINFIFHKRNLRKYLIYKTVHKKNNAFFKFYKILNIIIWKRVMLYFYYRQLIFINKSKFNYIYLQYLKNYLQVLFNKNIEFNLINIKRFYLDSTIFSESVKIKLAKNRRIIYVCLDKIKEKIKVKNKNYFLAKLDKKKEINYNKFKNNFRVSMQKNIIKDIRYKKISGFRLEVSGRLTKRATASRSITRSRYKGNLLDLNASYKGLSAVLLKGNLESNIQYTKLKSKTRIGSFGLKGWISGN